MILAWHQMPDELVGDVDGELHGKRAGQGGGGQLLHKVRLARLWPGPLTHQHGAIAPLLRKEREE